MVVVVCQPAISNSFLSINVFFSTKIHHFSNSHVTPRTLTSRCSWTMRLVKVGHHCRWGLSQHGVEMCSIFHQWKWLKVLRFRLAELLGEWLYSDVFNLLAFFEMNHFHPIEIMTFHPSASESSPITGPIIDQLEENLAPKTSQWGLEINGATVSATWQRSRSAGWIRRRVWTHGKWQDDTRRLVPHICFTHFYIR